MFMMGFCCCAKCPRYKDDFAGADESPYVPNGFEKIGAGTLAVAGHKLTISGANTGILSTEPFGGDIVMRLNFVMHSHAAGEQTTLRWVFAYQDADNYHAFELRQDGDKDSTGLFVYLLSRIGGVETVLREVWWRGAVKNTDATDHTLNRSNLLGGIDLNYDPVSGWVIAHGFDNFTSLAQKAIHRFATPPAGGKLGLFTTSDADRVTEISYVSIFEPIFNCAHGNEIKESCPDQVGYLCDHSVSPPGDELELTIAGIGVGGACNGAAINGTYVLQRIEHWDDYQTKVPYLKEGTGPIYSPWDMEGSVYRYELPAAVCNLKYIDVLVQNQRYYAGTVRWVALLDAARQVIGAGQLNTLTQTDAGDCTTCYTLELSGPPESPYTGDRIWGTALAVPTWEYQASTATAIHLEDP